MNRIRKIDDIYQVLITPNIRIAPDSPILVGNWSDESLRGYYVLNFSTLNDAQAEAFKYPDIDWHRLIVNHQYIYERLKCTLEKILGENQFIVEFHGHLMGSEEFKNKMFDRVMKGGERFNMRYGFSDLISFKITSTWSNVLHRVSLAIENFREHLYLDTLRIREKKIVDGKIICLYGLTEFGSVYEIKLVPSLLDNWGMWFEKVGYRNPENANKLYKEYIEMQKKLDAAPNLI